MVGRHAGSEKRSYLLMENRLAGSFNEDATVHQGKKHNYKAIRLYAIKGEPNGTLDIARKTHTEHLDDMTTCKCAMYKALILADTRWAVFSEGRHKR